MAAHAKLSASGAHRWMVCPASVAMEATMPDTSSEAADSGTADHELAEKCLREDRDAVDFIGHTFNGFEVDEERAEAVQVYIDYVRNLPGFRMVEQRVDFSQWVPDGFGTTDCAVIHGDTLHVIDLKGGQGVRVYAENNPQAMLYGLGTLTAMSDIYDIQKVVLVIVQPRLDHIDEWEISEEALLTWAHTDLRAAAEAAVSDTPTFSPDAKACQWCKAKAVCKPLAAKCLEVARGEFADTAQLNTASPSELADLLKEIPLIQQWCRAVEGHALTEALSGRPPEGYKLVEGRSLRVWSDELAASSLLSEQLGDDRAYTRKLISPAQAEKALGKNKTLLADLISKPAGKPTLVPDADKRQEIQTGAVADFSN